jgi:DNA-directed RNA polymerase subunit RPC12/RpoP
MKAIICTQCGATIENVSERSVIIECEYCGARLLLSEGNDKPKIQAPIEPPGLELDQPRFSPGTLGFAVAVALVIPIAVVLFAVVKSPQSSPAKVYSAPSPPASSPKPIFWGPSSPVPEKPLPVVNYQPRVAWDGPNDLEHFEDPEVDVSSVSNLTSEEVEKTVFKNRVVKLRVVINTEGEIDKVETISGHPILVAAATESAKRSIFTSRSKPTTRILTYTFRVLKD